MPYPFIHLYKGVVTAGAADGQQVSEYAKVTLTAAAIPNDTTIQMDDPLLYGQGMVIKIDSEIATVASKSGSILTLSSPLTSAHALGAEVKSSNSGSSRLKFSLDNESSLEVIQTVAIRCDPGYNSSGNTTIQIVGLSANKIAWSLDGVTWQDYGAPLTIASTITDVNTLIYVKAKCDANETGSDISVYFSIATKMLQVA